MLPEPGRLGAIEGVSERAAASRTRAASDSVAGRSVPSLSSRMRPYLHAQGLVIRQEPHGPIKHGKNCRASHGCGELAPVAAVSLEAGLSGASAVGHTPSAAAIASCMLPGGFSPALWVCSESASWAAPVAAQLRAELGRGGRLGRPACGAADVGGKPLPRKVPTNTCSTLSMLRQA